ncbi:MAG: DNA/RNA nuclease SfsA, partial [Deltaproteobacteria bacterium]
MNAPPLVVHRFGGRPIEAILLERRNKFLAVCRLLAHAGAGGMAGEPVVLAHVPDRGRCLDLLIPGQRLVLVEAKAASGRTPRRTGYTA